MDLLIIDPHALLRQGLVKLFQSEPSFHVIGSSPSWEQAEPWLDENPSLVTLSSLLPAFHSGTWIWMYDMLAPLDMKKSIQRGCQGWISYQRDVEDMVSLLLEVGKGHFVGDEEAFEQIKHCMKPQEEDLVLPSVVEDLLTAQEYRVLVAMAQGKSNPDIGQQFHISEKTVKNHVSSIFKKLGVKNRTEAALVALQKKEPLL